MLFAALAIVLVSKFRPAAASYAAVVAMGGFAIATRAQGGQYRGLAWLAPVVVGFVAGGIFYSNKALDAKAFYPIAATVIPVLLIPLVFQLPRDRTAHAPRLAVQVTIALLVLGEGSALIATGAPGGPVLPSRARRSAHVFSRAAHGRAPLSPRAIQATRPHPDHHLPLVGAALAAGLVGILVAAFPQSSPGKGGDDDGVEDEAKPRLIIPWTRSPVRAECRIVAFLQRRRRSRE